MESDPAPSRLTLVISIALFLVLAVGSIAWFCVTIYDLVRQLSIGDPVIVFDKGLTYMLGLGIFCSLFALVGVRHGVLKKTLEPQQKRCYARTFIASIFIAIVLPQLLHLLVANYSKSVNYHVCSGATYRWLAYSKIYYAKDDAACSDLVDP